MKKSLYLFLLCIVALAACKSDDEVPSITLSDTSVSVDNSVKADTLTVIANNNWTATSDQTWCVPNLATGVAGTQNVIVKLTGNTTTSQRTANIVFKASTASATTTYTQAAEEHYSLPVIFHVLYKDASDTLQYISQAQIQKVMTVVNKLYSNNNMNLEFVLATTDPNGNTLSEAGVDRQQISSSTINCDKFMDGKDVNNSKYVSMLWNLNKYINIFLYNFDSEGGNYVTLGITDLPYVSSSYPLSGLSNGAYYLSASWDYPQCSSINSLYMYQYDPSSKYYNPMDITVTIAHELGHYLGLFHVFTETGQTACSGDDYCSDTPNYDRSTYETWLSKNRTSSSTLASLAVRTGCSGTTFTSHNIMDYEYGYSDEFTTNQRERVRYILNYGLFIPGTKYSKVSSNGRSVYTDVKPEKVFKSVCVQKELVDNMKSMTISK